MNESLCIHHTEKSERNMRDGRYSPTWKIGKKNMDISPGEFPKVKMPTHTKHGFYENSQEFIANSFFVVIQIFPEYFQLFFSKFIPDNCPSCAPHRP